MEEDDNKKIKKDIMGEQHGEKTLYQKSGFDSKEFILEDQTVLVRTKTLREELEYRVRYDELGFELVWKKVKQTWFLLGTFFLMDILFAWLFVYSLIMHEVFTQQLYWCLGLVFFVVITLLAIARREMNYLYVSGGVKSLEFWADKPGVIQVTTFVESLQESMRAFYRERFNKLDDRTSVEELMVQLRWLLEIKAITEEEFEAYLEGRKSETVIGFRRN